MTGGTFPFGRSLKPTRPSATEPKPCFLIGAYPSAFHIRWTPPAGYGRSVTALAVDNEPTPFWSGEGEAQRLEKWRTQVRWHPGLGEAESAVRFNGSSGRAIDQRILAPLGLPRSETWITDCLDTYHLSVGMAEALAEVYEPFARERNLPKVRLPLHPSTADVVRDAQMERLRSELRTCRPQLIITLGEAALGVSLRLLDASQDLRLAADSSYGTPTDASFEGQRAALLPLVHPGQRSRKWSQAHAAWLQDVSSIRAEIRPQRTWHSPSRPGPRESGSAP